MFIHTMHVHPYTQLISTMSGLKKYKEYKSYIASSSATILVCDPDGVLA